MIELKDNTKRLRIISVIVTAAFAVVMISGSLIVTNNRQSAKNEAEKAESTPSPTAAPIAHIVLDPGHGGFDGGAAGTETGITEDVINLAVAKLTEAALEKNNISVELTRNTNDALADSKKEDMRIRREKMHAEGVTLTVSIHMNKFKDRSICGPMVFYTPGDTASNALANCVIGSLCMETGNPQRLSNPGDYYVIRDSSIPAIIVECGFLSNAEEEKKLCDDSYRAQLAIGIANGIMDFLDIKASEGLD